MPVPEYLPSPNQPDERMKRREALTTLSWITGGSLLLPMWSLQGCEDPPSYQLFTPDEVDLIEEVAETILPETEDSPGAKATGIGAFVDLYLAEVYKPEDREVAKQGLIALEARATSAHAVGFRDLTPDQRHALLVDLDEEAKVYMLALTDPEMSPHYFAILKSVIMFGYFTSEPGMRQALRYLPIPGGYRGEIPYQPGDKAWAM